MRARRWPFAGRPCLHQGDVIDERDIHEEASAACSTGRVGIGRHGRRTVGFASSAALRAPSRRESVRTATPAKPVSPIRARAENCDSHGNNGVGVNEDDCLVTTPTTPTDDTTTTQTTTTQTPSAITTNETTTAPVTTTDHSSTSSQTTTSATAGATTNARPSSGTLSASVSSVYQAAREAGSAGRHRRSFPEGCQNSDAGLSLGLTPFIRPKARWGACR